MVSAPRCFLNGVPRRFPPRQFRFTRKGLAPLRFSSVSTRPPASKALDQRTILSTCCANPQAPLLALDNRPIKS